MTNDQSGYSHLILYLVILATLVNPVIQFTHQSPTTSSNILKEETESPLSRNRFISSYTTHDPITITSNEDFNDLDFPGNGTIVNPYLIKGYNITTTDYCILIKNTDAYFVIRGCVFAGGELGSGILLGNVSHGVIQNNIISQKNQGVSFWHSSNNMVKNNAISKSNDGVYLYESSENMIANNTVSANLFGGVHVSSSSNNIVVNNTLSNNRVAISLGSSFNNTLTSNIMVNNGVSIYGNEIEHWQQSITTDNLVNWRPLGYFWGRTDETIDETQYGQVILANCNNMFVENGVFNNASKGITLGFSTYCNLINNNLSCNSLNGINFHYSSNNVVVNNNIFDNSNTGVFFESSSDNVITNNNISGNLWSGVRLRYSSSNKVVSNRIFGKPHPVLNNTRTGVDLKDSSDNTMMNNTIKGNN